MLKTIVVFLLFIFLLPVSSIEQVQSVLPVGTAENGSLNAVVYDWEVIGVNPANLGWSVNHQFSFTVLDIGASAQSTGMTFPSFLNLIGGSALISKAVSMQQIMGAPNGANINADINWFACSFRIAGVPGAFAANIRDRVFANTFLGHNGSQAIVNNNDGVYTDSAIMRLLDGTNVSLEHYREINLDYGVGIFNTNNNGNDISRCFSFSGREGSFSDGLKLYAGIGFKYIFGIADINGGVYNSSLNAVYEINSNYPNIPGGFFNTPGHGYAFDFGLSAIYKHWKFGLSLTDLGHINWSHGSVVAGDTNVATIKHGSDFINELKSGTLPGSVPAPSYRTSLPTDLRGGTSYTVNKKFLLSGDVVYPITKVPYGLSGPYIAVGCQFKATKIVTFSTGFAIASGFGWGIPLGATFNATDNIQFYLGTGDITSYFGKTDADVSLATWLFRYNF